MSHIDDAKKYTKETVDKADFILNSKIRLLQA